MWRSAGSVIPGKVQRNLDGIGARGPWYLQLLAAGREDSARWLRKRWLATVDAPCRNHMQLCHQGALAVQQGIEPVCDSHACRCRHDTVYGAVLLCLVVTMHTRLAWVHRVWRLA